MSKSRKVEERHRRANSGYTKTNTNKDRIEKTKRDSKYHLCKESEETVVHLISC